MASVGYALYGFFLATMMLIFGTINTVFNKYMNLQQFLCEEESYECEKCPTSPGEEEDQCIDFEQPVFQTMNMFIGEFLCLIVYYIMFFYQKHRSKSTGEVVHVSKLTGWKRLTFAVPTVCDMIATTLMNLGLIYTYASVFQMLRGAVVIFTGVFSVFFLKRKQKAFHWLGIIGVVLGVTIVGLSSVLFSDESAAAKDPLLGDILIVGAQVFTAFQFVYEEKYLAKYEVPPLEAVGYEGLYGVLILIVLIPIFQFTLGNSQPIGNMFDLRFAYEAFLEFPSISISAAGTVLSIAFFNTFGLTITKVLSATARSTIDACRTLSVWIFGLIVGWEVFKTHTWLQVAGFVILILGTFTYNQVIKFPCFVYDPPAESEETKPLNAPFAEENGNDDSENPDHNSDDEKSKNYSTIN